MSVSATKFDCDSERGFSVILENDSCVKKWFKPSLSDFKIHYNKGEYTPDFVIETADAKLIVETKAEKDIESQDVKEKARAAVHWCQYATQSGGKPWIYLLIPDNKIDESKTFPGLIATFAIAALDQG